MTLLIPRHRFRRPCCYLSILTWVVVMVILYSKLKAGIQKQENKNGLSAEKMTDFYFSSPPEVPDPFINQHHFKFTLSSDTCDMNKYYIIMLVHSNPANSNRRELIRRTYGSVKEYQGRLLAMMFLLGAVEDKALQKDVDQEFKMFQDIVQGNFLDNPKNRTVKQIMGMHWVNKYCITDLVVNLDDSTFINPYRLVNFISSLLVYGPSMIFCNVVTGYSPIRDPKSEWYIPTSQYPFDVFPPYCEAAAYITTPEVFRTLYKSSATTRHLDMPDVYVTGILATIGGAVRINIDDVIHDCSEPMNELELFSKAVMIMDKGDNCSERIFYLWGHL